MIIYIYCIHKYVIYIYTLVCVFYIHATSPFSASNGPCRSMFFGSFSPQGSADLAPWVSCQEAIDDYGSMETVIFFLFVNAAFGVIPHLQSYELAPHQKVKNECAHVPFGEYN